MKLPAGTKRGEIVTRTDKRADKKRRAHHLTDNRKSVRLIAKQSIQPRSK